MRNGVEIISYGRAVLLAATESFEITIVWGLFPKLTELISAGTTLNQLQSDAKILYQTANPLSDYNTADGYLYAGIDWFIHDNTVDYTFNCLSAFLDIDDFEHADKFCHYLHKIYLHRGQIGKTRMQKLEELFGKALHSDNENLRFQILANIYYQETDNGKKEESLLPLTNAQFLAEIALSLIKEEEDDIRLQRKLEFAVFFAEICIVVPKLNASRMYHRWYPLFNLFADSTVHKSQTVVTARLHQSVAEQVDVFVVFYAVVESQVGGNYRHNYVECCYCHCYACDI